MTVWSPQRAFVLAAGYGARMLPLSRDLPKPLMPLWGKPLLRHTLEMLSRWGVRDVLVNLHHQPGALLEFLRGQSEPGLRISLSFEPDILGTGGALRKAEWFFDGQPFWLVNSDIAADVDPGPLARAFCRKNAMAALWLHPDRGPRTVEMRGDRIVRFDARRPGAAGTFTFCGLHLVSPRILRHIPRDGFAGIIGSYVRAMRQGEYVAGVCIRDTYWADLGTPAQYLDAHAETRAAARAGRPGGRLYNPEADCMAKDADSFIAADGSGSIARNAVVTDSVVWAGARVGAGARVHRSVIGRGARVEGRMEGTACRADVALDSKGQALLEAGGIRSAEATLYSMPVRGSGRTFARIGARTRSAILVRYDLSREENALYGAHARLLARAGVRVPTVWAERPDDRMILLEDLGERSLADAVRDADDGTIERIYRETLDLTIRLHERGTGRALKAGIRLMPPFDARLYRWERTFFAEEFLRRRAGMRPAVRRAALHELRRVARRLLREPPALIHRDLQSSNILLTAEGPAFIDFQGMRMGPAAYDLASLLCDPYVELSEARQQRLLDYYNARARVPVSLEAFRFAAVERLAQAMGAYARLGRIPGMERFDRYLAGAARQQRRAAEAIGNLPVIGQIARRTIKMSGEKFDRD